MVTARNRGPTRMPTFTIYIYHVNGFNLQVCKTRKLERTWERNSSDLEVAT